MFFNGVARGTTHFTLFVIGFAPFWVIATWAHEPIFSHFLFSCGKVGL